MNTEISKNLMCILMRAGVEIWLEEEYIKNLKAVMLSSKDSKFLEIGNEIINTADVVGVFEAKTMQEVTRRKNGQWKDDKGVWHDKGERLCPKCKQVLPFGMTCGNCRH